jgi:uncharacterized protein
MNKILTDKLPQVAELCRSVGVRKLEAFGSVVRGDFDENTSDLDFLVEMQEVPALVYGRAYFKLKDGLEALFGRSVDLLTIKSLTNPYLQKRISEEKRAVYAA